MKELWTLFWTFAKMGVMTFGGGMAMLPILQREVVENKHWATEEELTDYYAIGQCTPGIIAVNTATFIGQKYKGIAGGIVATLGVVFPSPSWRGSSTTSRTWPGSRTPLRAFRCACAS